MQQRNCCFCLHTLLLKIVTNCSKLGSNGQILTNPALAYFGYEKLGWDGQILTNPAVAYFGYGKLGSNCQTLTNPAIDIHCCRKLLQIAKN